MQVESARLRELDKLGGMSGDFFLLDVTLAEAAGGKRAAMALKTTSSTGAGHLETAKSLGTPREGLFYSQLGPELAEAGVPKAWYAHGDMATGEKLVLMECLEGAVPCGVFFGAGNPNNWGIGKDKLAKMTEGAPSMKEVSAHAFRLYARLHARFWRDKGLLEKDWLRGADWAQGRGEASWMDAQRLASDAWAEQKALLEKGEPAIQWDPHVVACLDQSFSLVAWDRFQAHIAGEAWTLVHGDCHPHNALWSAEQATMALIDFEMVGIGSPAQELGQYLVSHMPPDERRAVERELVQGYHAELCANLRGRGLGEEADGLTFDACWREYVMGGAGRWLWFVPYLAKMCPPAMGQFFHDQLAAFLHDHLPRAEEVGMPRV